MAESFEGSCCLQRSTISVLLAILLTVICLGVSFQSQWATSNSQGLITYTVREAGLPFQWMLFEVSSPVGPSSFFKVDPVLLVIDFVIWACVTYGVLYVLKLPRGVVKAPLEPPPST